jgi:hypothetical protein
MRRSLYKYFSELKWAEAFINGQMLFRSLAYFRDYEDENVRKDEHEGTSLYQPEEGLLINNLTKKRSVKLLGHAFESTANQEEIFVFCMSRTLDKALAEKFAATVCVEIQQVQRFCARIQRALPANATFRAGRVEYYDQAEGPETRWALPDEIVMSKVRSYEWQREFRVAFCLTDAMGFEKASYRVVKGGIKEDPRPAEHHEYRLEAQSLRDLCRLHDIPRMTSRASTC